jgi:hypothetical protein
MSIKGCASETVRRGTTFYVCPVDRQPCVVLEPVQERMVEDLGRVEAAKLVEDAAKYGLPCGSCRRGAQDARNLSGLRLGRHERRILLFAPPGSKCGWRDGPGNPTYPACGKVVYPEEPSRAAEEANRRALRKLERSGLVELSREWVGFGNQPPPWFLAKKARSRYWARGRRYRTAKLTPLGELVVARCRRELEGGKPIRWQKLLGGVARDVERPPAELLREFALWLGGAIFGTAFGARFARTEEARLQLKKRGDAMKRFKAFVSGKAAA